MTLYHLGNCLALIYAPYHMAYKFSGISEYSSLSKCVYVAVLYLFTQLCKMLLLATFFPDFESSGSDNIFLELLKAVVDIADLAGIYFALNSVPGKGHAKIFTVGIGWAGAEVASSQLVSLWYGARGSAFSWRPLLDAVGAGVALVRCSGAASLVWSVKRASPPSARAASALLLLSLLFKASADRLAQPTLALALRSAFALFTAVVATAIYAQLDAHTSY